MPVALFFLLLLLLQMVFLPGLLIQGSKVSNPYKTIIIGGINSNPPYEFLDEDNEPDGYNVDLSRAIATELGVDIKFKLENMKQIKNGLKNEDIDIIQGVMESFAKENNLLFLPHTPIPQKVFSLHNKSVNITSLDQLYGKNIIIKKGGITHNFLLRKQLDANFILVNTRADALLQLASGKYDYALLAATSNLYLKRQLAYLKDISSTNNIAQVGELQILRYGFATTPKNKDLLNTFNAGLVNLEKNGLQQEIHDRWLGSATGGNEKELRSLHIGSMIFTPLIFVICIVFFWNRSLKREVERRSKELALKQQQLIQADKMASLGTLVSGVAHEINNPTGLILYNISVLEKIYQVAESTLEERFQEEGDFFIGGLKYSLLRQESAEVFSEIKNGATRIKQIVDDLKDFAYKDGAELSEIVDLNQVLSATVRLLDSSLKEKACKLSVSCAKSLPTFMGNSHRIEQVIINLLLNACQAINDSNQKVIVRTYFDSKNEEIILEVTDEGVGIAPDQLDYLTDPFYTTKRTQGGTGLGLSISAGIVKEHKGKLNFASQLGVGTTVSVHLPIHRSK